MQLNVTTTPPITLTVEPGLSFAGVNISDYTTYTFEAFQESAVALDVSYSVGARGEPGPQGPVGPAGDIDPGDLTLIFDNQVI